MPEDHEMVLAPLDEQIDHVRGSPVRPLIIEYGDYECPYSRQAYRAIERAGRQLGGNVRFAFSRARVPAVLSHVQACAAGQQRDTKWLFGVFAV
jgi:hypothetical protein